MRPPDLTRRLVLRQGFEQLVDRGLDLRLDARHVGRLVGPASMSGQPGQAGRCDAVMWPTARIGCPRTNCRRVHDAASVPRPGRCCPSGRCDQPHVGAPCGESVFEAVELCHSSTLSGLSAGRCADPACAGTPRSGRISRTDPGPCRARSGATRWREPHYAPRRVVPATLGRTGLPLPWWRESRTRCGPERRNWRDETAWARSRKLAGDWLARLEILHPRPTDRFAGKHPRGRSCMRQPRPSRSVRGVPRTIRLPSASNRVQAFNAAGICGAAPRMPPSDTTCESAGPSGVAWMTAAPGRRVSPCVAVVLFQR